MRGNCKLSHLSSGGNRSWQPRSLSTVCFHFHVQRIRVVFDFVGLLRSAVPGHVTVLAWQWKILLGP